MSDQQQLAENQKSEAEQPSATQPEQQASQATQESCTIDVSTNRPADEPQVQSSKFAQTMSRVNKSLLERHISYDPVSILFTILVLIGGIWGFATGSLISLIASVVFAILLAIGTYLEGARKNPYPLLVVLFLFGGAMMHRYYLSMKFWPAGLYSLLTLILIARHCYLIYLRGKYNQVN